MRELSAAIARAGKDSRRELRAAFVEVAEPVARDAQSLALAKISRMAASPRWSMMRVGVTRTSVYVAPKKRGVTTRGADPRRRPNLADLMMDRAMQPALEQNEHEIEAAVEHALDRVADHFNH
jgi:16S rRNA U516 pseudouridylate synthase RsuA-like enzyme